MVLINKELQWVNVKQTKVIQADFLEAYNQANPGIIQAYSKPCVTLAYLEPWFIQNPDIFKIRNIFRTLVYSEPPYIQNPGVFNIQGLFRHLRRNVL